MYGPSRADRSQRARARTVLRLRLHQQDGIRYISVTRVQTCALPIRPAFTMLPRMPTRFLSSVVLRPYVQVSRELPIRVRSEERRVGNGCRSWGWSQHEIEK